LEQGIRERGEQRRQYDGKQPFPQSGQIARGRRRYRGRGDAAQCHHDQWCAIRTVQNLTDQPDFMICSKGVQSIAPYSF